MFSKIFSGKTVFVTGHTGFMGTWLSLWLYSMGAKVVGYSLKPSNPSMFEIIKLDENITHIIGNVNDVEYLYSCVSEHKPEFIFHLAAQPLVRLSYEKPVETFQTNIMGTINILESIRNITSARVCVVMTSDKCYQNRELNHAFTEDDPMGGYDPYSASKGATELVTSSYRNSFFNPDDVTKHKVSIATARAGNMIGGGDWAKDRLIPDCVNALISKKSVNIRNPNAIRPWQHVLEPISGILCLAIKMWRKPSDYAQAWNFGPLISNNKTTVKELVTQIIHEWGYGDWVDVSKKFTNVLHEANTLILDSKKAINSLGWHPVYSIKEVISETISWYRSYDKKIGMKDFTLTQIKNYVKKAKQMNIAWTSSL